MRPFFDNLNPIRFKSNINRLNSRNFLLLNFQIENVKYHENYIKDEFHRDFGIAGFRPNSEFIEKYENWKNFTKFFMHVFSEFSKKFHF